MMLNIFPARECQFIGALAGDLHLSVTWDEYDKDDQNLVTWRFPGMPEEPLPDTEEIQKTDGYTEGEGEGEWEVVNDDNKESQAAVDRVLKKYGKAQVTGDKEGGGFDARYEPSVKEKMDEWKRGYYWVC
jgi:5'-3' exoribonuclease 1